MKAQICLLQGIGKALKVTSAYNYRRLIKYFE